MSVISSFGRQEVGLLPAYELLLLLQLFRLLDYLEGVVLYLILFKIQLVGEALQLLLGKLHLEPGILQHLLGILEIVTQVTRFCM